jgi:signal transduction histidine kinase
MHENLERSKAEEKAGDPAGASSAAAGERAGEGSSDSASWEARFAEEYLDERRRHTLLAGRIYAVLAALGLGFIIYRDVRILDLPLLVPWRLLALAPALGFLVLSLTRLRERVGWVIGWHAVSMTALVANSAGITYALYILRPDVPGYRCWCMGALFIAIVGAYIFSSGARRFLPLILAVPLLTLVAALYQAHVLTVADWGRFVDPLLVAGALSILTVPQERMARSEFRMRRLSQLREVELAEANRHLEQMVQELREENEERRRLELRLGQQAQELLRANRELEAEARERQRAMRLVEEKAEELARSNRDLQQFAQLVSHDLKAPLRTIRGRLQLLQQRLEELGIADDEAFEELLAACRGAERMQGLIDAALEYSLIDSEPTPFAEVSLREVLEEVRLNLESLIASSGARIEYAWLPRLRGDRAQLVRLFQNLIHNSIKFRRPDQEPLIQIEVVSEEDGYRIMVRDNGIGFNPRYAEKAFEAFSRLHDRQRYEGAGVGLAICKRIVERHGGTIWIETQESLGATVHFRLARDPGSGGHEPEEPDGTSG